MTKLMGHTLRHGITESKLLYLQLILSAFFNQERLESHFQRMSLGKGVVGDQPTLEEMKSVLSEWDAYMYCGHGANLKNVSSQVEYPYRSNPTKAVLAVPTALKSPDTDLTFSRH